jgi:hypothetical protein
VSTATSISPAAAHVACRLLAAGLLVLASACSSGSGNGVVSDQGAVTLLDVQAQVLSPRCALSGCHVGAGAPFGLDLSSGASAGNLVGVPAAEIPGLLRVEPGNGADSYLYMKVIDDPRILGDPMPATGGPLSAGQLNLIETWIDQGAM